MRWKDWLWRVLGLKYLVGKFIFIMLLCFFSHLLNFGSRIAWRHDIAKGLRPIGEK